MTFTYFCKTGEIYRDTQFGKEWDGDTGYDFEYEPRPEDLEKEIKKIIVKKYGDKAWDLICEANLISEVCEHFDDELWEAFEDRAMEGRE